MTKIKKKNIIFFKVTEFLKEERIPLTEDKIKKDLKKYFQEKNINVNILSVQYPSFEKTVLMVIDRESYDLLNGNHEIYIQNEYCMTKVYTDINASSSNEMSLFSPESRRKVQNVLNEQSLLTENQKSNTEGEYNQEYSRLDNDKCLTAPRTRKRYPLESSITAASSDWTIDSLPTSSDNNKNSFLNYSSICNTEESSLSPESMQTNAQQRLLYSSNALKKLQKVTPNQSTEFLDLIAGKTPLGSPNVHRKAAENSKLQEFGQQTPMLQAPKVNLK